MSFCVLPPHHAQLSPRCGQACDVSVSRPMAGWASQLGCYPANFVQRFGSFLANEPRYSPQHSPCASHVRPMLKPRLPSVVPNGQRICVSLEHAAALLCESNKRVRLAALTIASVERLASHIRGVKTYRPVHQCAVAVPSDRTASPCGNPSVCRTSPARALTLNPLTDTMGIPTVQPYH